MDLLNAKIKKCEDFLAKFRIYRQLGASDAVMGHDMEEPFWGLSEILFRTKIAMVVKFLEEMGNTIDEKTLKKMNATVDEEWALPDEQLICAMGSLADPFLKVVSLNALSGDANAICAQAPEDALENVGAVYYADNEDVIPKELQDQIQGEDGEVNFDLLEQDEQWKVIENILVQDLIVDLDDLPFDYDSLRNIATGAVGDAQCENYLYYFAEWDKLLPCFAKKYVKYVKRNKNNASYYSPRYLLDKRAGKDARKVWDLAREADLTLATQSEVYDLFRENVNPMEVYVYAFGEMQGWGGYPFDVTQTDVAYPVLKALQHLYLFKCNRRSHFLPEEYAHGDELIFPNFKL